MSSHLFFLLRSCQSLHSTFKESALGFTDLIDILLVSNLHYLFPAVCLVIGLVQFSSAAQSCPPLCDPMDCSMPGLPVHHQLPELAQTHESVMLSNHLILCRPLLLLPSNFSSIRVFSNESVLHVRWPEYWSFRFGISSSNEYSGLISFRMNWLDLLAVQGTRKSLFQHHSSEASV